MNEEELNAIDILTEWKEYNIKHKNILREADTIINVQETILNLIEKQSKEIEKISNKYNLLYNQRIEQYNKNAKELKIKFPYIPKQKIEDKIEEIRKKCLTCTIKNILPNECANLCAYKVAIKELGKLLIE